MFLTASVVNDLVFLTILPRAFVADAIMSVSHVRQVFVSYSLPPFYFYVSILVAAILAGFSCMPARSTYTTEQTCFVLRT